MDIIDRKISKDGFNSQFSSLRLNQVGYETCDPLHSFGPAIRDHNLFHYVISGSGTYYIKDKKYPVKENMIFMIPPDVATTYVADESNPWTYYWIGFSGLEAKQLVNIIGFNDDRYVISYEDDLDEEKVSLKELIHKLATNRVSHESDKLEEISRLYKVISLLRKNYERSAYVNDETEEFNRHVRIAIDYIMKKYTLPITVQDIANYVGIDRTQLFRLFNEIYSFGPKEYLIKVRLKKAEELLRDTDLAIKSVSYSVGYLDQYLFSKIFKKYYTVSPKYYREKSKKSLNN